MTESMGAAGESLPEIDGISPQWRRLYFLRNAIRTVHEIRKAVQTLRSDRDFKQMLSKQPKKVQHDFDKSYKELVTQEEYIKDLRDKIAGGHVLQKAVQECLNQMDPLARGLIQIVDLTKDTRFKFSHNLVLGTMFPGLQDKDHEQELSFFIEKLGGPSHAATQIIELIFTTYAKERRLV